MAVRRSGAPWRSFATRTSVRCPTTSRPRRIQPVRRSSSARLDPSVSAARSGAAIPAGSRTRRRAPARRANATSRASRSASPGGRRPRAFGRGRAPGIPGAPFPRFPAPARSRTRTSTARAWRSEPGHGERLVGRLRHEDREPFQAHATGDRLDGVEAARQVDPRHERAAGLGLRDRPQGEGGRATGSRAAQGDRPGPRQAAGREEPVELCEAGGDRPVRVTRCDARNGAWRRSVTREPAVERKERGGRPGLRRERGGRKRPEDLRRGPRRSRSPACPEARKGGDTVGVAVHRTSKNRTSVRRWEDPSGLISSANPAR